MVGISQTTKCNTNCKTTRYYMGILKQKLILLESWMIMPNNWWELLPNDQLYIMTD